MREGRLGGEGPVSNISVKVVRGGFRFGEGWLSFFLAKSLYRLTFSYSS